MDIQLVLHPYGCEDAAGGANCSFGPALRGLRNSDGQKFTFALGRGRRYRDYVIMIPGHVDEQVFRGTGLYQLLLINKHPDYQKPTFQGQRVIYCFAVSKATVPYTFPSHGNVDLHLVNFDNFG